MWWNFVGRDHDDIVAAREEWMRADPRFGTVHGYPGDRAARAAAAHRAAQATGPAAVTERRRVTRTTCRRDV